jgi:hypothetical protein
MRFVVAAACLQSCEGGERATHDMVDCGSMAATAAGRCPAAATTATADGMDEAAAHAARAAVRRPVAGYAHPALARSRRRNDLLHLFANHRGAFAADRIGLCAIRSQHDRLDELPRGRSGRRGARRRRTSGDHVTARRRHRHPTFAFAGVAASSGTSNSRRAAAFALGYPH